MANGTSNQSEVIPIETRKCPKCGKRAYSSVFDEDWECPYCGEKVKGDVRMNALKTVELLRKYNKCANCGSDKIGNRSGTLEVEEDTFKRTCKCGWVVVINDTPEGALSSEEIAAMHQDGTLCQSCGAVIGEPAGEPRLCGGCED